MDAIGRLKKINNKGVAVVLLALMIVVLVAFVGLAVDIGYMYIAKGQLQNAADAGALAGAAKLPTDTTTNRTYVRSDAELFGEKNIVVPSTTQVQISNNNTNSLTNDNDILVGNWKKTRGFSEYSTPTNAVKVRARRTTDSPGGPVDLFFARIMGHETMNTAAKAVAAMIPASSAGSGITVCVDFCTKPFTGERVIVTGTDAASINGKPLDSTDLTNTEKLFAWTSYEEVPTGSGINVANIICNESLKAEVCDSKIYTKMGGETTSVRLLESVMYDPDFDADHKEIEIQGNTKKVKGWTITVPVTKSCPPGIQGSSVDPHDIYGYASIHVKLICSPGVGSQNCPNRDAYAGPQSECNPYKRSDGNSVIVINAISCFSCDEAYKLPGIKPRLVE